MRESEQHSWYPTGRPFFDRDWNGALHHRHRDYVAVAFYDDAHVYNCGLCDAFAWFPVLIPTEG